MERIKSVLKQNGAVVETKYYFGAMEVQTKAGITRYIHYINAGNGLCAIAVKENGVTTVYYAYSDYLGSILTLTDNTGAIAARQNFDAWGRYRNPDDWTYNNVPSQPVWLYRGFTGHEHLKEFALINMNGRMYDPVLGRMLSPDNYVPLPWNTQGYNRYSYANNNPLVYVDPDGNFWNLIIGAVIGGVINVVSNWGNINNFWDGLKYFGVGAASGSLSAGIGSGVNVAMAGGNFGAGFMGAAAGVSSTGFIAGAVTGVSAGFTNGFITGLGNTALGGSTFRESLMGGLNSGWKQGLTGGISGGIFGGIDAMSKDVNFFTGKAQMDLSSGYGAHGVATDQTITGKLIGDYEGVNLYESSMLGEGKNSSGVTLPGRGIIVGKGAFTRRLAMDLVHHEYGHILQAREVGMYAFYNVIARESLISAGMNNVSGHIHNSFWTETWANYLSKNYFGSGYFANSVRFPVQNISLFNYIRLRLYSPFFWP